MPTTTNYGWTTPADTDLVKDGALAIRTLGNGIDTTTKNLNPETTAGDISYRSSTSNVNTRLAIGTTGQVLTVSGGVPSWATPASSASGLTLITKSTFSASSSHSVNNCFSVTYNNYLLLIKLQGSTTNQLRMRLRVSGADSTSSIYVNSAWYVAPQSAQNGAGYDDNVSSWALADTPTADVFYTANFTLFNPFLAEYTQMQGILNRYYNTTGTDVAMQTIGAWHKAATSYTGFTLFPDTSGTITGEVTVYGYQIS